MKNKIGNYNAHYRPPLPPARDPPPTTPLRQRQRQRQRQRRFWSVKIQSPSDPVVGHRQCYGRANARISPTNAAPSLLDSYARPKPPPRRTRIHRIASLTSTLYDRRVLDAGAHIHFEAVISPIDCDAEAGDPLDGDAFRGIRLTADIGVEIGYNTVNLFSDDDTSTFDLPVSTRTTLSAILIVHPIAALFTLVMLILAASAHFHSPSHSPRYLLGLFILSILTFILALLSFLIDVLLFVPHMAWGSYLVLAGTILIAASGIVSCAMRRTLVSRKARKRRIAENAEMNGENFYNRQETDPLPPPTMPSAGLVSGSPATEKLPAFATFESKKEERTSDERIPLTTRSPSDASAQNLPGGANGAPGINDRYGGPPRRGGSPPTDQYGNPMPPLPQGPYGGDSRDPSLTRQYSDNSRGRGGMVAGGFRGRGGYPSNGRGGYGPPGGFGPPNRGYGPPRGGYGRGGPYRGPGMNDGMMAPMAAGALGGMAAGPMMRGGRGGRGGPPPGYGFSQAGRAGYGGYGGAYGRGQPPTGYTRDVSPAPQVQGPPGGYVPYNDDAQSDLPRAESPPPLAGQESEGLVGQAIEMDATTGSPSHAPKGFTHQYGTLRDSDGDISGMVGLQQQRQRVERDTLMSESSKYSADEPYVPPRQVWAEGRSSPLNPNSGPTGLSNVPPAAHKRSASGEIYYEDVDPRFAEPPASRHPSLAPGPLAPGSNNNSSNNLNVAAAVGLDGNHSAEDIQSGSRSPAESDRSNFTSVSQRGVNPRWNGGPAGYEPPVPRRPVGSQRNDVLLASNPDFELPGGRGGRGGRGTRGGGIIPGSAYPS
ncbi:hypothetical protein B7494_g6445 [Chlorociboria aeruginascens]|nr:hypothetical protein B7494_g6445 [Chlorociboria aeruginascens]